MISSKRFQAKNLLKTTQLSIHLASIEDLLRLWANGSAKFRSRVANQLYSDDSEWPIPIRTAVHRWNSESNPSLKCRTAKSVSADFIPNSSQFGRPNLVRQTLIRGTSAWYKYFSQIFKKMVTLARVQIVERSLYCRLHQTVLTRVFLSKVINLLAERYYPNMYEVREF